MRVDVSLDVRKAEVVDAALIAEHAQEQLRLALVVLCMCDSAYCEAAKTPGTGVHSEVQALSRMQGAVGVKIVPIFLEAHATIGPRLPPLLVGRLGVAMYAARERRLSIVLPLLRLLNGGAQEDVQGEVDDIVATYNLREKLKRAVSGRFTVMSGDPRTHRVRVDDDDLCVIDVLSCRPEIAYYLRIESDEGQTRWHWSGCGTGPSTLGAAIVGHCFPGATLSDTNDLVHGGRLLAVEVFQYIHLNEPMMLFPDDVVAALTSDAHARETAERLLSTAPM